jgi:hypothetical protein
MRAWAEAESARLGLSDRVIFTGMLRGADKIAALVDAAVLALPSYHENFGIVVAESLAVGTPVVVSDQVYLHPQVTSAGVGGVVRMDIDLLAKELDRWMGDESLRTEAARRARPVGAAAFQLGRDCPPLAGALPARSCASASCFSRFMRPGIRCRGCTRAHVLARRAAHAIAQHASKEAARAADAIASQSLTLHRMPLSWSLTISGIAPILVETIGKPAPAASITAHGLMSCRVGKTNRSMVGRISLRSVSLGTVPCQITLRAE